MFIWAQTNLKILKANFSSAAGVCLKSMADWGVKLTLDTVNLVDCYFKGLKYAFIAKLSQIKKYIFTISVCHKLSCHVLAKHCM